MATRCFSPVRGRVMRVTRLDGCGRPIYGACAQVTSDGFVSVALTANVDEGEAIDVRNAAGRRCVYEPACPELLGYTAVVQFCDVDPDLFQIMTGQEGVIDPQTGDTIGFKIDTAISGCDFGFALEVWTNVPGVACDPDDVGEGQFGYLLLPFMQGGVFGDFTIENGAITFQVTGAATKDGSGWGLGPYEVMRDAAGEPSALNDPVGPTEHMRVFVTSVAPPEPSCGCQPLEAPELTMVVDVLDLTAEATFSGVAPDPADPGTILVDWGDGTALQEVPVTGADPVTGAFTLTPVDHVYALAGPYTITATYFTAVESEDIEAGAS